MHGVAPRNVLKLAASRFVRRIEFGGRTPGSILSWLDHATLSAIRNAVFAITPRTLPPSERNVSVCVQVPL